jgi:hypothetical protein
VYILREGEVGRGSIGGILGDGWVLMGVRRRGGRIRRVRPFLGGQVIQTKHDENYGEDGKVWDFDED